MQLSVVSLCEQVFEGDVQWVVLPGSEGTFQVLKNHAPLVGVLRGGIIRYGSGEGICSLLVEGGIVEVLDDKVTVFSDT